MKALNTLRNLIFFFVLVLAASSASATDGAKLHSPGASGKLRKADSKPAVERTAKPQRREVAAFVDPTAPLAELVERVRSERATH
jgi:hypothetical protein